MLDALKSIGVTGLAVLVCYYLVRDVLAPLVKMTRKKVPPVPALPPVLTCPHDNKLQVLELNLNTLTAQVSSFETLLEQSGAAMDQKLDIVLAEAKDFRDLILEEFRRLRDTVTQGQKEVEKRITAAETHIEHLLRPGPKGIR